MNSFRSNQVILILLFIVGACATVTGDWEYAKTVDSSEAYESFLRSHPNSEYEQEARSLLEDREWTEAAKKDWATYYEIFVKKYPNSSHANKAKKRISELSNESLDHAVRSYKVKHVKVALESGADPNYEKNGVEPLWSLVYSEARRVRKGITLSSFDGDYIDERREIARLLIDAGADVTGKNDQGETLLEYLLGAKTDPGKNDTISVNVQGIRMEGNMRVDPVLVRIIREANQ